MENSLALLRSWDMKIKELDNEGVSKWTFTLFDSLESHVSFLEYSMP